MNDQSCPLAIALTVCCFAALSSCSAPPTGPSLTSGKIVVAYDPSIVHRTALASTATYAIDQPGGVTKSFKYATIGFRDQPTAIVRDEINAALIGTTASETILAFRGTMLDTNDFDELIDSIFDWANDVDVSLVQDNKYSSGRVHQGFRDSVDSLWDEMLNSLKASLAKSKLPLVVTGHSKGGALARLAALRLEKANIKVAAVYTFAAPRAGDTDFANEYHSKIGTDLRFEFQDDIVPHVAPRRQQTADFLAKQRPEKNLSVHDEYDDAGTLQFLSWDGTVKADTDALDQARQKRLKKLFLTLDVGKIAGDHSLVDSYLPQLEKFVRN